jgi:hypothetical protein
MLQLVSEQELSTERRVLRPDRVASVSYLGQWIAAAVYACEEAGMRDLANPFKSSVVHDWLASLRHDRRGEEEARHVFPWVETHMDAGEAMMRSGELPKRAWVTICFCVWLWLRGKEAGELGCDCVDFTTKGVRCKILHAKTGGFDPDPQYIDLSVVGADGTITPVPDSHPWRLRNDWGELCHAARKNHHNPLLGPKSLARYIKLIAARCGHDVSRYSCHSLRRGGCWAARRHGMDVEAAKVFGRWKSEEWRLYSRMEEDLAGQAAFRAMAGAF